MVLASLSAPVRAQVEGPIAGLDYLTRSDWQGGGEGFSTLLRYRWLLPGRVLEATNEVRNAAGEVLARYAGAYAWDAERGEMVFWTAGDHGELHRGRAWVADGVLWHEAEVSGGRVDAYASALRRMEDRVEYYAAYGEPTASLSLLESEPILYRAITVPHPRWSARGGQPAGRARIPHAHPSPV